MTATPERPALDEATLAFAEKVFDAARQGDAARLALWLDNGLPPDLRNAQSPANSPAAPFSMASSTWRKPKASPT